MVGGFRRSRALMLVLLAALALAVAACSSGGSATDKSSSSKAPGASVAGDKASQGAGGGEGAALVDSASKLSEITSYRFKMTFKGGSYAMIGSEPITGTIVTSPSKAAHINIMGMEVMEVDGKSYVKLGTSWMQSSSENDTKMADDFAPSKMFGSFFDSSSAAGYKAVGNEKKNGVDAIHFQADASILNTYGSLMGVEGGKWSADAWVAKDGGYPVSVSIKGTGGSEEFEFTMDITNVNDPANKVEAPI